MPFVSGRARKALSVAFAVMAVGGVIYVAEHGIEAFQRSTAQSAPVAAQSAPMIPPPVAQPVAASVPQEQPPTTVSPATEQASAAAPTEPAPPVMPCATESQSTTGQAPTTPQTIPEAQAAPELIHEASELVSAYQHDKSGADAKFKGMTIYVRGVVDKLGKKDLQLKDRGMEHPIKCKFSDGHQYDTAAGSTVVVKGVVDKQGWTGTIGLNDCELVSAMAH